MYISDLCATLTVREIDGSQSELSLRRGPNEEFFDSIYCARLCSDDGIVIQDESSNLTKFTKDGEFIWTINPDSSSTTSFCLDSSDLLYCVTDDQVKVYLPTGAFSHVLVSDVKDPIGIAVDVDDNIHVGFSCASSIRVFSAKGKLIREYGHDELGGMESIAISRDNPQLVVTAEYDSSQLFVFNDTGSFLYTVMGVTCVGDITFGPDNSLWIAEWEGNHFGYVLRIPKLFPQLPPPLSYLCELSILPHLNELPVSLLPPRLAGLFEKWTDLVTVEVRRKSFTNHPSKSKLLSDTIELKVEPNAPQEMVQWLVCKKMDVVYSETSISRGRGDCVDFILTKCEVEADSLGDSGSETEEL